MKGATPTKSKRRKFLSIPEEEFFDIVLLLMGPPKQEYFEFQFNRFEYGIRAWVKHTPEGQKYLHLVVLYGEAKVRASLIYKRYARWCRSNDGSKQERYSK